MTEEKESERKKRRQSSLLVVEKEVDRRKTLAGGSVIATPIHQMGKTYAIIDQVMPLYQYIEHDVFQLASVDVFQLPQEAIQKVLSTEEGTKIILLPAHLQIRKRFENVEEGKGLRHFWILKRITAISRAPVRCRFQLVFSDGMLSLSVAPLTTLLQIHTYLISPVILLKTVILFYRSPVLPLDFHIDEDGMITVRPNNNNLIGERLEEKRTEYKQRLIKFLNCWIVSMFECLNNDQNWRKLFVMFCNQLTVSDNQQDADVCIEATLSNRLN